jgi:undecaprenyl diphosphate synthase
MSNLPKHIALIPDGNRRWARQKNLPVFMGHQKGVLAFEKILEKALELQITYFTFWGSSMDNIIKRSKTEVNYLFKIFEQQFTRLLQDKRVSQNQVKVQIFGRWREMFPQSTVKPMEDVILKTKLYNKYYLTFLMAYNGTDEMIECIKKIQESKKNVTEKTIKENLWTKDLPPVDLIIRTGTDGDPHLSAGFMMWDAAYSQLEFSSIYFPAFTPKEFEKIVLNYVNRQRRKGS